MKVQKHSLLLIINKLVDLSEKHLVKALTKVRSWTQNLPDITFELCQDPVVGEKGTVHRALTGGGNASWETR